MTANATPPQGESDSIKQIRQNAQGFLAILDVAAERFLEELDYRQEAANGARFEHLMGQVRQQPHPSIDAVLCELRHRLPAHREESKRSSLYCAGD